MKRFDTARIGMVVLVAAMFLGGGGSAKADFVFGTPTKLGPLLNSPYADSTGTLSADGLELYLNSTRPGGFGDWDIWVAKRETTDAGWGALANLGPVVNSAGADAATSISQDGLELYFCSQNRSGGYGGYDIWVTRRAGKDAEWGAPVNLGPMVNSTAEDLGGCISADGLELYFCRGTNRADILVTRRETKNDPWRAPVNLGPVVNSSGYNEAWPYLSADGLLLFFSDFGTTGPFRPGGCGGEDLWVTTRATTGDDWGIPRNLGRPVNSSLHEDSPILSPDGSTLYFARGPGGSGAYNYETFDIWQAPILPIVDFNGDGKVDGKDVLIMAEHWGQHDTLCDIGPMAWGDGVVDVKDLIILAGYIGKDIEDPTLIACWKLDETSGAVAYDSAGAHLDATVMGHPAWQPAAGMVGGALQFDGVDDYVQTLFVRDPSAGPFSVSAWIKGGMPGQVILSQIGVSNWLSVDSAGHIGTELKTSGRSVKPLWSQTVATDGRWHRVGLVSDGMNRILYVDDVEVGRNSPGTPVASSSGFYMGASADLRAGSFWSGLIDDVRIYNRVVEP